MKIAIVGFGNMGKTFANGFVNSQCLDLNDIDIFSRSPIPYEQCFGIPKTNIHLVLNEKILEADIIIISVKPQDFVALASDLQKYIAANHVILSVMAGVTIQKIAQVLQSNKVVRAMPNLPTQISLGITALTASEAIDRKDLFIIQNLINTTGKSIYVEDESLINAATAVSGSGPAYVFYFMQSMIDAAVKLGFTKLQAQLLVKQTFLGAVNLYNANSISIEEWIGKVSSKGGTTEQAILSFQKDQLNELIVKGVIKANLKAIELGS